MKHQPEKRAADAALLEEENRKLRLLRVLVDTAVAVLRHRPLSRAEADQLVTHLRRQALTLFPEKDAEFDLIYGSRLRRVIEERFGPDRVC